MGETKLKILAIIYYNELQGAASYGYKIWTHLKEEFRCYLDNGDLRNVYRHLKDLNKLGLVDRGPEQLAKGAPKRQPYSLTDKGRRLKQKFSKYLQMLEATARNSLLIKSENHGEELG